MAPPKASAEQGNWDAINGVLSSPGTMATIIVEGGEKFYVHKKILTQSSVYFDKALNGFLIEGKTQSITFDDISSAAFGRYINLLYQTALVENVTLHYFKIDEEEYYYPWIDLLQLWQLADRFLDRKVQDIVEGALEFRFERTSVRNWLEFYERQTSEQVRFRFSDLEDAWTYGTHGLNLSCPFAAHFVAALSNAPPQVFAEHAESLKDPDLKAAVTKEFAMRMVDPKVEKRKKDRENQMQRASPKKQKKH